MGPPRCNSLPGLRAEVSRLPSASHLADVGLAEPGARTTTVAVAEHCRGAAEPISVRGHGALYYRVLQVLGPNPDDVVYSLLPAPRGQPANCSLSTTRPSLPQAAPPVAAARQLATPITQPHTA